MSVSVTPVLQMVSVHSDGVRGITPHQHVILTCRGNYMNGFAVRDDRASDQP